jgi:hypothetical protein
MIHEFKRVWCAHCGHSFDVPVWCGNRFCEVCGKRRISRIRKKLLWILGKVKAPRGHTLKFITLTVPNCKDLKTEVKFLINSFRRLRNRRLWRNYVSGGCWVIEVTGRPNNWHHHIHIIAHSRFFPVKALSREWGRCSNGNIVWITRPPLKAAIAYLTSYVTKSKAPPDVSIEVSNALKGFRLFQPFGTWHHPSLAVPKVPYTCPHCHHSVWVVDLDTYITHTSPELTIHGP